MTETIPSDLPHSTKRIAVFFALLLFFTFGTSFSFTPPASGRASNAEAMQLRNFVTGWAQNYVGIKYRHAGKDPQIGFDCSGFTSYVFEEFDVKVSASSAMQSTQGIQIGLDEVLPGDLVFFGRGSRIQHVALVVEKTPEGIICVHSTCSRGVIVENISTSSYWKPRIMFARDVISTQARNVLREKPVEPDYLEQLNCMNI
jgi:cell wall-associated NlpC family hydrolase